MPNAKNISAWSRLMPLLIPPDTAARQRRVDLAITDDGRPIVSRAAGVLAPEATPMITADAVELEDFSETDLASYLAAISTEAIDATRIGAGTVDNTEFGYLDGVTSAVQTQLDAKAPTAGPTFTELVTVGDRVRSAGTSPTIADLAAAGTGRSSSIVGTDRSGLITLTTGTGTTTGDVFTVTFNTAKADADYGVVLFPFDPSALSAVTRIHASTGGRLAASWTITAATALNVSEDHLWFYLIESYEP